jgi:hypothetical protein
MEMGLAMRFVMGLSVSHCFTANLGRDAAHLDDGARRRRRMERRRSARIWKHEITEQNRTERAILIGSNQLFPIISLWTYQLAVIWCMLFAFFARGILDNQMM